MEEGVWKALLLALKNDAKITIDAALKVSTWARKIKLYRKNTCKYMYMYGQRLIIAHKTRHYIPLKTRTCALYAMVVRGKASHICVHQAKAQPRHLQLIRCQ